MLTDKEKEILEMAKKIEKEAEEASTTENSETQKSGFTNKIERNEKSLGSSGSVVLVGTSMANFTNRSLLDNLEGVTLAQDVDLVDMQNKLDALYKLLQMQGGE